MQESGESGKGEPANSLFGMSRISINNCFPSFPSHKSVLHTLGNAGMLRFHNITDAGVLLIPSFDSRTLELPLYWIVFFNKQK